MLLRMLILLIFDVNVVCVEFVLNIIYVYADDADVDYQDL